MDKTLNDINEISHAKGSIEELVNNTDIADIKAFLIDLLKDDPMLLQQFKLKIHYTISTDDLKMYQYEIASICKRYTDKYGFISYSASRGFQNELSEFLQHTIVKIIDNKEYAVALKLIQYVYITLGKIDIDDSNGTLGSLAYCCIELLQTILQTCSLEVKKITYQACKDLLTSDIYDYLQNYIEELFFSDFTEDEFLYDKLIFSEMQVNAFFQSEENFSNKYAAETWVTDHLNVMKQLNFPQEAVDDYCKKYIRLSGIRTYYVDECIKMKRYDEAIQILEEGKCVDSSYGGLVLAYSNYEDVLKDLAPEEILKRYELIVRNKAADVSSRAVYQEIAGLLKRMQRYPGGKALVQTLIAEFRTAYRRRPAMIQELDNV